MVGRKYHTWPRFEPGSLSFVGFEDAYETTGRPGVVRIRYARGEYEAVFFARGNVVLALLTASKSNVHAAHDTPGERRVPHASTVGREAFILPNWYAYRPGCVNGGRATLAHGSGIVQTVPAFYAFAFYPAGSPGTRRWREPA